MTMLIIIILLAAVVGIIYEFNKFITLKNKVKQAKPTIEV